MEVRGSPLGAKHITYEKLANGDCPVANLESNRQSATCNIEYDLYYSLFIIFESNSPEVPSLWDVDSLKVICALEEHVVGLYPNLQSSGDPFTSLPQMILQLKVS